MNNQIKWLAAGSLTALMLSGCTTAPAPWANNNQQGGNANARPGTNHQHGNIIHSHPLPDQGIHHAHQNGQAAGIPGRAVGSGGGSAAQNNNNQNNNTNNNQNNSQTYGYDYGGYGNNTYGGSNYDTGNNSGGNFYGDIGSGGGNNYSGNSYGGNNSGSNYDNNNTNYGSGYGDNAYDTYGSGSSSSSNSDDLEDVKDPNYRKGDTYYTVQKTNTVFAVMRITDVYWKDVVKWNNLEAPKYTIYPGQRLRLKP